jgi:hypothetical protein
LLGAYWGASCIPAAVVTRAERACDGDGDSDHVLVGRPLPALLTSQQLPQLFEEVWVAVTRVQAAG